MDNEIKKEIDIRSIRMIVKPAKGLTNQEILGFAELELVDNSGLVVFKVRGFVIKKKFFGDKEVIVLNPPAYPTSRKLFCSFFVESKDLWREIESTAISGLQKSGEINISDEVIDIEADKIINDINNSNY